MSESMKQSKNKSLKEWINERVTERMGELMNEWVNEWVNERMKEWNNENNDRMKEWENERIHPPKHWPKCRFKKNVQGRACGLFESYLYHRLYYGWSRTSQTYTNIQNHTVKYIHDMCGRILFSFLVVCLLDRQGRTTWLQFCRTTWGMSAFSWSCNGHRYSATGTLLHKQWAGEGRIMFLLPFKWSCTSLMFHHVASSPTKGKWILLFMFTETCKL